MTRSDLLTLGAGAAVVVLAVYLVKRYAPTAAQAVNPFSDQNLAYRGTNAVGAAVTGNPSFNLGAWIWEATHPAQRAAERDTLGASTATPPYVPMSPLEMPGVVLP